MTDKTIKLINQVFFISTTLELSVNRKDLQAPTLVGPFLKTQDMDPLAEKHLANQLYMNLL